MKIQVVVSWEEDCPVPESRATEIVQEYREAVEKGILGYLEIHRGWSKLRVEVSRA